MDVSIMYGADFGDKTQSQIIAANIYLQELEAKGILTLVGAATELYNKLVPQRQRIDLETHCGFTEEKRKRFIANNWRKLHNKYNQPNLRNPELPPVNIKQFLIKMAWIGYEQLSLLRNDNSSHFKPTYLTWQYFDNRLKILAQTLPEYIDPPMPTSSNTQYDPRQLLEDNTRHDYISSTPQSIAVECTFNPPSECAPTASE